MSNKTFNKDDVIFRQGDIPREMYDILSGSVGVYVGYGTENETQLTVLKAGDFLGEMGMIESYPRSATAVAMEEGTELREIGTDEFSDFFKGQPERLLAIMKQLSQRLRDRTEDYEAACKVLESLKETASEPEKRSKSLLQKVKEYLAFYDSVMNTAYQMENGACFPDPFMFNGHF
ncbi:MAG: cyclic nucleotide-binding domain-containing protein [Oscillospiraceae bacterium]|nr:cyclic nucleotide-binding domain-containing protein [Oscillospiraceae bacterium]